jgi:hypothetical protein
MTYTAMLSLSIIQDDFTKLDRVAAARFVGTCQREDGRCDFQRHHSYRNAKFIVYSFATTPNGHESDLRTLYCAFSICKMLNDWSSIDLAKAISSIKVCRVGPYTSLLQHETNHLSIFRPTRVPMAKHRILKLMPDRPIRLSPLSILPPYHTRTLLTPLHSHPVNGSRQYDG